MKKLFTLIGCIFGFLYAQSQWNQLGSALFCGDLFTDPGTVYTIRTDASGNLYAVMGQYTGASVNTSSGISNTVYSWDGANWNSVGRPWFTLGPDGFGKISALTTDNTGKLYVGGQFVNSSGKICVAVYENNQWQELGTGSNSFASVLANSNIANSYEINQIAIDANGNVYASGFFWNAALENFVAKWDGTSWSELGTGADALHANNSINCITTDAAGNVYAAGNFTNSNGKAYVAKWDGSTWHELGAGGNELNPDDFIYSITTDALGNVYATGGFNNGNGKKYVAKWDGSIWSELGTGSNALSNVFYINSGNNNFAGRLGDLCCDATGNLYVNGPITTIGTGTVIIPKWNGAKWETAGGVITNIANNAGRRLTCSPSGNVFIGYTGGNSGSYCATVQTYTRNFSATLTANRLTGCQNGSAPVLTFQGKDGRPPYTFGYTINNGLLQTVSTAGANDTVSIVAANNTAGIFTYSLVSLTDNNNETAVQSASLDINFLATPSVTINTASTTVCEGSPVLFNATVTNPGTTSSYNWENVGTSNTETNNSSFTFFTLADGNTVKCTYSNEGFCSVASNEITMTVAPVTTPSVSIAVTSGNIPGCQGAAITFTATASNAGSNPGYQWKLNGTTNIGSNSPTLTYNAFNYGDVVTCTVTSDVQCPASETSNGITVTFSTTRYYRDMDSDGFGVANNFIDSYDCIAPEGYSLFSTDCDDNNNLVSPVATEILGNSIDDNCNNQIDEVVYCTPFVSSPCFLSIQNVTLNAMIKANNGCSGGYSDFSSTDTASALVGGTVNFSIEANPGGLNQRINIYVDYNNDGDFDDSNEQVVTDAMLIDPNAAVGSFNVPVTQAPGTYRLRVVGEYEANPSPTACATLYGEAEDYILKVSAALCTPVIDNPCSSNISDVNIGSINNASACTGYDDYSATVSTAAAQSATVNFSITSVSFTDQNVSIYIDYNNDADFDDAGEQVAANVYMNAGIGAAIGSFQIPALQAPGSYRLRVISDLITNTTQPCHSEFGEAEDYTLIVEPSCPLNTWTGAANDGNWNNAANWCGGLVPASNTNAKIPVVATPYPALTADASVNNIEIESGATLSLNGYHLTLNGVASGTGSFIGSAQSSLTALNSGLSGIYFAPGANVLKNLTLGNNAQLFVNSGDLEIAASPAPGTVTLGEFSNFYCSNLIFKSGPNGTARLAELPVDINGQAIVQLQGQQTVERYIPNNGFRSWRLLSVPTHGSGQTIRQAWQEGTANPSPLQNNLPGYGTQISGTGSIATAQAAGFDNTAAKPSLLYWNNNGWNEVSSTNNPIDNKQAYFLYLRGDRTKGVTGSVNDASPTTLRTNGSVYMGNQQTTVPTNALAVVGNVYPSAINFSTLGKNNVTDVFYIWDSKKLNGTSLGAYQTFSGINGYNCILSGGSYVLGQPNTTIESGQAFLVRGGSTIGGGTITLTESSKTNGSTGLGFRPVNNIAKTDIRLYNADGMRDAATVVFDNAYSNEVDRNDAPKLSNPGENMSIQKQATYLAIEGRQPVTESDTIQLRMWNLQQQQYRLEIAPQNMSGLTAYIEDDYLKTATTFDISSGTTINFTVDANTVSAEANRFKIVFDKTPPVTTETVTGYSIAPNPVENGIINIKFKNKPQGKYSVRIISTAGQIIISRKLIHTGGSASQNIALPTNTINGHYKVEIIDPGKLKELISILVNKN